MPKSKRTKLISLTRTKPKTRDAKTKLLTRVKLLLTKYTRIAVVSYQNMNASAQLALRSHLGSISKIIFGKKSILKLALGGSEESSDDSVNMLCDFFDGQIALVFTNQPVSTLKSKLENFSKIEFAQPGSISPANVVLSKGDTVFKSMSSSNDEYLRNLGLDVNVNEGKLNLVSDFLAAGKGQALTSEQCKILKLLGIKLGKVKVEVRAIFDKENFRLEKYV
jgi:mRNA turnover protein 4